MIFSSELDCRDYVSDAKSTSICHDRDLDTLYSGDSDCDIVPSLNETSDEPDTHYVQHVHLSHNYSGLNMMIVLLTYSNCLRCFYDFVNHTQYCMHCEPISMPGVIHTCMPWPYLDYYTDL